MAFKITVLRVVEMEIIRPVEDETIAIRNWENGDLVSEKTVSIRIVDVRLVA